MPRWITISRAKEGPATAADTMMSRAVRWPPWEVNMEQVQATGAGETNMVILVAIELSKATWLLAICDPVTGKVSRRRVDGGDAGALIELLERHRRDAQARKGMVIEIECVFEAGYDGF